MKAPDGSDRVPVIFRAEDEVSGRRWVEVTAVFPTIAADYAGGAACYAHVGQHGSCDYDWYRRTRAATVDEIDGLRRSLRACGYRFPGDDTHMRNYIHHSATDLCFVEEKKRWLEKYDAVRRAGSVVNLG